MMRASTHFRLFLAQLILMLSFLFLGCYWIRDHHWPTYWYWIDAVIVAFLGFLIPTGEEPYRVTSSMPVKQYWLVRLIRGKRQAEFSRWLQPPDPNHWDKKRDEFEELRKKWESGNERTDGEN